MKQKKSNLGQLVLTCTDVKDLERQLQDHSRFLYLLDGGS